MRKRGKQHVPRSVSIVDGTPRRIIKEEVEMAGLTTNSILLETVRSREETLRFLKLANNLPSKM
jgi:hypothetical protein